MSKPIHHEIYQMVWEACEADGPEDGHHTSSVRFRLKYATALLGRLLDSFTEESLVKSEVAYRVADGLIINPALTNTEALIALRHESQSMPFALLTSTSIIPSTEHAEFAVLRDHPTRSLIAAHGHRVFLALSRADVVMLRRNGLPVALAVTLMELDYSRWQEIERRYRWTDTWKRTANEFARQFAALIIRDDPLGDRAIELILVAWSPADLTLDQPERLYDVTKRCIEMERYAGLDMSRVGVWMPTAERIAAIRYSLDVGATDHVRVTIEESSREDVYTLEHYVQSRSSQADEQPRYGRVLQRLEQLQGDPGAHESSTYADAIHAVLAAADQQLVFSLLELADNCEDPWRRNLIVQAAHIATAFIQAVIDRPVGTRTSSSPRLCSPRVMTHGQVLKALPLARAFLDIYREV
jgi:hypothetical protein